MVEQYCGESTFGTEDSYDSERIFLCRAIVMWISFSIFKEEIDGKVGWMMCHAR
jgi:hypothetical protein